jgi:hypothetical protein
VQKAKTKMLSKEFFAELYIEKVYKQRLGDMTDDDAYKEGGYTLEEYKEKWNEIYTNSPWDDDREVWVVEFHVVK